jgi:hypothetical protein
MNNRRHPSSRPAFGFIKTIIAFFKKIGPKQPYKTRNQKHTRNLSEGERHLRQDNRMYRINAVLVFVTLVVAGVSAYQAWLSRRQFEIATTPYLQINKVALTIKAGHPPMIAFEIENLTKVPTKIVFANLGDSVSGEIRTLGAGQLSGLGYSPFVTNSSLSSLRAPDKGNRYAIEGSPYQDTYTAGYTLDSMAYDDIMIGKSALYFRGQIAYINEVNNENRAYIFEVRITENPTYRTETISNNNYFTTNSVY